MYTLRIVGGIFAIGLIVLALLRYRRRSISRLNLIIAFLLGVILVLLALAPVIYTPVFDLFSFSREKGSGQRLIAVELFALLILFALIVRAMISTDQNERALRLHFLGRHRMDFGVQAHRGQQRGGHFGVASVVARRGVGGHADERLQKANLFVEVRVDPGVEFGVEVQGHVRRP